MMQTKKLRGECQQCGQVIEFDAEVVGTTAECPHCGQPTELILALPAEASSPLRTKAIVFGIVVLVILLGGAGGTMLALKRARRMAQHQATAAKTNVPASPKPTDPFQAAGFRVSAVSLDKKEGSSAIYATGAITNATNRQRFAVRVELDVLDDGGNKLGAATDYRATLEPNEEWRFRALVVEKKATSAKVVTIKEDR